MTLIKKPGNVIELNQIMTALVGGNIDAECMYCFKTAHITFESSEPIAWTLDGEFGGNHKDVVISNEKQALQIIVPQGR